MKAVETLGLWAYEHAARTCFCLEAVIKPSSSGTSPATTKTMDTRNEAYTATRTSCRTVYVTRTEDVRGTKLTVSG